MNIIGNANLLSWTWKTHLMRLMSLMMLFLLFFVLPLHHSHAQTTSTANNAPAQKFRLGVDVASDAEFGILKGKKLGLIVNHSSLNAKGEHLADVLATQKLAAKLFAPEHGIRGEKDEENLRDDTDPKTNLPVISLYKSDKKAPSDDDVKGLDALVFDIQEVGVRYYTYASTMVYAMKAAAKANIEFYVLDRPNPCMPHGAYGPTLDKEFEGGFISLYPIPTAHGLTIGELAKFYNEEYGIKCKLTVIKMDGYTRGKFYDELGVGWRNPSPNIRSMDTAIMYQLFGWLEGLDVSVGRGTDAPFLQYGTPSWIAGKISLDFQGLRVEGMRFVPNSFTPNSSKFQGKLCQGFRASITDRTLIDPFQAAVSVASIVLKNLPDSARTKAVTLAGRMFGSKKAIEIMLADIKARKEIADLVEDLAKAVKPQTQAFIERSKKYRLYE
jgi:uncharacterized protein YbbC (DUF1343 family)